MKPTAFNYAEYEALQTENAVLEADLAAAVEDIRKDLTDEISHSCEICFYYKNCSRNSVECEHDAKWRGRKEQKNE